MIHAWYEKIRDQKDHIYFARHTGMKYTGGTPFPGFHNSIELAFGLRGAMEIVINGRSHVLHEGEVCFINSMEPHRYYYKPGVECYVVLISSGFFTDANQWGSISFPTHMKAGEGFERVRCYLDYALETWNQESLLCKRAFADTLAYLMQRYYPFFPKQEIEKQNATLLDALKYICEHYTERLTVGEVAARFGYSANYFSGAFNAFIGTSFPDYLNTCRLIEYYRIRRMNPNMSTLRAAEACGFGSMNTFYRVLRKFESENSDVPST